MHKSGEPVNRARRLENIQLSFSAISLATTTPVTEACISPRVMPAPSPIVYRFSISVSKLFFTDILEE